MAVAECTKAFGGFAQKWVKPLEVLVARLTFAETERRDKMELDQALQFAVVSSWDDLVKPNEPYVVYVEYKNLSEAP
jgi:hypothetical protein